MKAEIPSLFFGAMLGVALTRLANPGSVEFNHQARELGLKPDELRKCMAEFARLTR